MLPTYRHCVGHTGCERIVPTIPPVWYCASYVFVPNQDVCAAESSDISTSEKQFSIAYLFPLPGSELLEDVFVTYPTSPPAAN